MKFVKKFISINLIFVLLLSVFSGIAINAKAYSGDIKYYESIPETMYAITGESVDIYFKNIVSCPDVTVVFSASDDVQIDYYNNKVKLAAQTAGEYSVTWRIYDNKYDFIESGVMTLVVRNKNLKDMTVLVLGDSTVNAGTMTGAMLDLFEADGSELTLLGTRGSGENLHEGRGGWRSYDYCDLKERNNISNPFYKDGFDFTHYMNTQGYKNVDAVVIQLGINDIKRFSCENYSSEKTLCAFDSIITSIKSYNAETSIVISLTIPPNENKEVFEGATNVAAPEEYRSNIIRFVAELQERYKNTENVYFSTTNCSINTAIEINDVVHPTTRGYETMAQTHIEALNFIMNKEIISEPTRIISASYKNGEVNLIWVAMSNTSYYEVIRTDSGVISKTTDAFFNDGSVEAGTNYEYIIRTHFTDGSFFDSDSCNINVVGVPLLTGATNHTKGIKVTWNEVEGSKSYIVYRKKANSSWVKVGSTTTNSFIDTNVANANTYTYTVKAKLDYGETTFDQTGVSCYYLATPKLTSAVNRNNFVQVKWNAVKGAKGYYVYRKTSKNGKWKRIAKVNSTTYTDKSVNSNGNYFYTVRAYTGSDLSSYVSSGVATKYLSVPKLKKVTSGTKGVTLNFSAVNGAKNYYIYRKTSGSSWKKIATVSGNKTYYLDKSAVKGTKYAYTVRAVNGKYSSYYNTKGLIITDKY